MILFVNKGIPRSGSKAKTRGIPETVVCRILMFMWSFRPLHTGRGLVSSKDLLGRTIVVPPTISQPWLSYPRAPSTEIEGMYPTPKLRFLIQKLGILRFAADKGSARRG